MNEIYGIRLQECDQYGNIIVNGLDTYLFPEKAPARNWKTPEPIEDIGINGNPLDSYKPYINGKIVIAEKYIPYERNVYLRQFYDKSKNNKAIYKYTDSRNNTALCYVSYISADGDIGSYVETVELTIKIYKAL